MLLTKAADGGARLFDACGAAPRPEALALHDTAPLVPVAHMACPGGQADAESLPHHTGEGRGAWGADASHATPPWMTGQPKAPLETCARTAHHTHQRHAALAGHHHTCCTTGLIRMLISKMKTQTYRIMVTLLTASEWRMSSTRQCGKGLLNLLVVDNRESLYMTARKITTCGLLGIQEWQAIACICEETAPDLSSSSESSCSASWRCHSHSASSSVKGWYPRSSCSSSPESCHCPTGDHCPCLSNAGGPAWCTS